MSTESIYHEVGRKRVQQDHQWGGPEHDDQHVVDEWMNFIQAQIEKCDDEVIRYLPDEVAVSRLTRARLVKIAALAVAGIEAIDRQATRRCDSCDAPKATHHVPSGSLLSGEGSSLALCDLCSQAGPTREGSA